MENHGKPWETMENHRTSPQEPPSDCGSDHGFHMFPPRRRTEQALDLPLLREVQRPQGAALEAVQYCPGTPGRPGLGEILKPQPQPQHGEFHDDM